MRKKKYKGWFYGVIRKKQRHQTYSETVYEIHEIFPHEDGSLLWTKDPVNPFGETMEQLRHALSMMLEDTYRMPLFEIKKDKLVEIKRSVRR